MSNSRRLLIGLLIATISSAGCSLIDSSAQVSTCPPIKEYDKKFLARAVAEVDVLPKGSALEEMLKDYSTLRDQVRACRPKAGGGGGRVDDDGRSGYEAYMLLCLKNTPECREVYDPTLFLTFEDCAVRTRELARDPRAVASVAGFAGRPFRWSVHCRPVGMKRRPA